MPKTKKQSYAKRLMFLKQSMRNIRHEKHKHKQSTKDIKRAKQNEHRRLRYKNAKNFEKAINSLVNYSVDQVSAAEKFDKAMSDIKINSCANCKRTFPKLSLNARYFCKPCSLDPIKFTAANKMHPGDIPPELADLTYIEQMLIAQIHPVVSFYKINNAQYSYHGNVINFRQDIREYARVLPVKPSELASTILFSKETPSGLAYFRARANKIRSALEWLKENNIYYRDIEFGTPQSKGPSESSRYFSL
jgi:hypothetical protein